ncbi:MAG: GTPase [Nitrospiraceae bacterium]|nr:GTPase [Nitrospiraceae bacterium]
MDNHAKHETTRVLIMGAAGRDFHTFNLLFRGSLAHQVMGFTAAQIPNIQDRRYPAALAGALYPDGIPIYPEAELERLIQHHHIDQVIFAYSDVSHEAVMRTASRVIAAGASFCVPGTRSTMLAARKPVVSICATRTGAGKSPVSRRVSAVLAAAGLRIGLVRHPMPYGDLELQAVQRFVRLADLDAAACTIEEREEYEPHLRAGRTVYAGVDYEGVLRAVESEADVIVWDGGNNDWPFFVPDLEIVVVDPHRLTDAQGYFPGHVNLLRADVAILSKIDSASAAEREAARRFVGRVNPRAALVEVAMPPGLPERDRLRGQRILVVEDGPSVTHGGMASGAGLLAVRQNEGGAIIDPKPYAVGSLRRLWTDYPHLGPVLPAMGYGAEQISELESTIAKVPCDLVVIATPVDLARLIRITQPTVRVSYEATEVGSPTLAELLRDIIARARRG